MAAFLQRTRRSDPAAGVVVARKSAEFGRRATANAVVPAKSIPEKINRGAGSRHVFDQPHNQRPAAVWNSGGSAYDKISRGIADSIEHCVLRLDPQPGEHILDLSTGTGWTSRSVARRGARVMGVDIAADLVAAAQSTAKAEGLAIEYRIGDAESLPFADSEFDAVVSRAA